MWIPKEEGEWPFPVEAWDAVGRSAGLQSFRLKVQAADQSSPSIVTEQPPAAESSDALDQPSGATDSGQLRIRIPGRVIEGTLQDFLRIEPTVEGCIGGWPLGGRWLTYGIAPQRECDRRDFFSHRYLPDHRQSYGRYQHLH